jgi:hypothetical protein
VSGAGQGTTTDTDIHNRFRGLDVPWRPLVINR